jgi:hypothetical protein
MGRPWLETAAAKGRRDVADELAPPKVAQPPSGPQVISGVAKVNRPLRVHIPEGPGSAIRETAVATVLPATPAGAAANGKARADRTVASETLRNVTAPKVHVSNSAQRHGHVIIGPWY